MANEVTAQPTEKPKTPDDELSQAPEDLGKHVLECATEAAAAPDGDVEPDGTVEVIVPPNQIEGEEEE